MGCRAFLLAKQYQGRPRTHERQGAPAYARATGPAGSPPGDDYEVSGGDTVHSISNLLNNSRHFVAKQKWKVVVYCTLPVVKVGMTYPTRLHAYKRFAGSRVGHQNSLNRNFRSFGTRHDPSDFMRHDFLH